MMIQATIKKKNNEIFWYRVEGHASFDEIGKDIVCAGVSSLYITVTNTLLSLGRTFERDKGYFVLDATVKEQVALNILYDGIKSIADEYPDFCEVEVIEV